jgi:hypothetical protein
MWSTPDVRPTERVPLRVGVYTAILAAILAIAAATYALPFYGLPLSVALPVLTHQARERLWPRVTPRTSLVCSVLAWVGLWLPAMVDFFSPVFYSRGIEISTSWLIIPLAGPDSGAAVLWPALAATGVMVLGLLLTTLIRRPWPWVLAAWLAPWAHYLVLSQIPHQFIA